MELLLLMAKAQTLGARRARALAKRDGLLNSSLALGAFWAVVQDAKKDYEKQRAVVLDMLHKLEQGGNEASDGTKNNETGSQKPEAVRGRRHPG
jgi:hypothetical protein